MDMEVSEEPFNPGQLGNEVHQGDSDLKVEDVDDSSKPNLRRRSKRSYDDSEDEDYVPPVKSSKDSFDGAMRSRKPAVVYNNGKTEYYGCDENEDLDEASRKAALKNKFKKSMVLDAQDPEETDHFVQPPWVWQVDSCRVCSYRGPNLESHARLHADEESDLLNEVSETEFKCVICVPEVQFTVLDEARRHVRRNHLDSQRTTEFESSVRYFVERLEVVEEEVLFRCKVCQIESSHEKGLLEHITESHLTENSHQPDPDSKERYLCSFCDEPFRELDALGDHIEVGDCVNKIYPWNEITTAKHNTAKIAKDVASMITPSGHQCKICHKKFKTSTITKSHIKMSHLRLFNCNMCSRVMSSWRALGNHKLMVHNYAYKHCNQWKNPPRPELLEYIAIDEDGNLTKTCNVCSRSFSSMLAVQEHVTKMHLTDVSQFRCVKCVKNFMTEANLKTHWRKFHEGEDNDGEDMARIREYFDYPLNHSADEDKKWTCKDCQKTFVTHDAFLGHVRGHLNLNTDMCEICGKSFSSKTKMARHMREMHKINLRDQVMILDGHNMTDDDIFEKHLRRLPNSKIKCILCAMTLHRTETGINHVKRVHMKLKNVQCEHCARRFFDKLTLAGHVKRKHSGLPRPKYLKELDQEDGIRACMYGPDEGEPVTKCKKCKGNNHDKVFPSIESLRIHITQFHLKKKMLCCPYCNMSYSKQTNLDRHIGLDHGDKKPELAKEVRYIKEKVEAAKMTEDGLVICPLCEKTYSNHASLTSHLKGVHLGRRPQQCEICNDTFQQRGALRLHMKAKHKVDLPVLKMRRKDLSEHNRPNRKQQPKQKTGSRKKKSTPAPAAHMAVEHHIPAMPTVSNHGGAAVVITPGSTSVLHAAQAGHHPGQLLAHGHLIKEEQGGHQVIDATSPPPQPHHPQTQIVYQPPPAFLHHTIYPPN